MISLLLALSGSSVGELLLVGTNTSSTKFPFIHNYERNGDTLSPLVAPDVSPGGTVSDISVNKNGVAFAVGAAGIGLYNVDSGGFLSNFSSPPSLPAGSINACAYSADGSLFAAVGNTSPYVSLWSVYGSTFTKLSSPATLPTGTALKCAFSPNGTYLAVAHFTSPYITIYKISGTTFTKLANPFALPGADAISVAWSPDSSYLVVGTSGSSITVYLRSGDTFAKRTITTLPITNYDVKFAPSGDFCAVGSGSSPYLTLYETTGWTAVSSPGATAPTSNANGVGWSSDSKQLAVSLQSTPYLRIYDLPSTSLVDVSNPTQLPLGPAQCAAYFHNG